MSLIMAPRLHQGGSLGKFRWLPVRERVPRYLRGWRHLRHFANIGPGHENHWRLAETRWCHVQLGEQNNILWVLRLMCQARRHLNRLLQPRRQQLPPHQFVDMASLEPLFVGCLCLVHSRNAAGDRTQPRLEIIRRMEQFHSVVLQVHLDPVFEICGRFQNLAPG